MAVPGSDWKSLDAPDPQDVTQYWPRGRTAMNVPATSSLLRSIRSYARSPRDSCSMNAGDHTLDPTALVSELALRVLGAEPIAYDDRTHFFALAAQMMRSITPGRAWRENAAAPGSG